MDAREKFSKLMQQGHGRCAVILEKADDMSVYRDVVLNGCRRNFAYDAQCEGTRAWYVHRLTEFFGDKNVFVSEACEALKKLDDPWGWDFYHLCDLLTYFACDGEMRAADAIVKKYDELKDVLISKHEFSMVDHDRDHFNHIAGMLLKFRGTEGFTAVIGDIGRIIARNPHYDGDDFDQFDFDSKRILGKDTVARILAESTNEMTVLYRDSIAAAKEKHRAAAEARKQQSSPGRIPKREEVYDVTALLETLYGTTAEYTDGYGSGHHGASFDLIQAREKGLDVPDEALMRIYETTLCSCCRHNAVKLLRDTGLFTREMAEEAVNDCYEHTRNLAAECE